MTTLPATMKAAVTTAAGAPELIQIQERPLPQPKPGWVLLQVKAFGLNRSELFTRRGDSPNVEFPRIQGIECVGLVLSDPSGHYSAGQQVAAIMGGMGRDFDGGYAEYCLVPMASVFAFQSDLPWEVLGAIPEMFQTVSGSLNETLEVKKGEKLLIRGGSSSIGMLSCELAKHYGLYVISTTRNPAKVSYLLENGADEVLIDSGSISKELRKQHPAGVDKVLELVGTKTLVDSLRCIRGRGIVCMTGILGNEWTMPAFTPMDDIPSTGRLSVYTGDATNLSSARLQEFIDAVAQGKVKLSIDQQFRLDQIVEAHQYMEDNRAKGKIVVLP